MKYTGQDLLRLGQNAKLYVDEAKQVKRKPVAVLEKIERKSEVMALPTTPRQAWRPNEEERRERRDAFFERQKIKHEAELEAFVTWKKQRSAEHQVKMNQLIMTLDSSMSTIQREIDEVVRSWVGDISKEDIHASMEAVLATIHGHIATFEAESDAQTTRHKVAMHEKIKSLARILFEIGYMQSGEVDRLVEVMVVEENSSIAENHRMRQEVLIRLNRAEREIFAEAARRMKEAEDAWTHDRHLFELEIARQTIIETDLFKNPSLIVAVIAKAARCINETAKLRVSALTDFFNLSLQQADAKQIARVKSELVRIEVMRAAQIKETEKQLSESMRQVNDHGKLFFSALATKLEYLDSQPDWDGAASAEEVVAKILGPVMKECIDTAQAAVDACNTRVDSAELSQAESGKFVVDLFEKVITVAMAATTAAEAKGAEHDARMKLLLAENEKIDGSNEARMSELKAALLDTAHLNPDLEEAFQRVLAHLGVIKEHYELTFNSTVALRATFAEEFTSFIDAETLPCMQTLGVVPRVADAAEWSHSSAFTESVGAVDLLKDVPASPDGIEVSWLAGALAVLRIKVFDHMQEIKESWSKVHIQKAEKEKTAASRRLSERLAKHSFRIGKVALEWRDPKEMLIVHHKQAFERHVKAEKNGFGKQVKKFADIMDIVIANDQQYRANMEKLAGKIDGAQVISDLTTIVRHARDFMSNRKRDDAPITLRLHILANDDIDDLIRANEDYRRLTRVNEEFSEGEKVFYSEQLDKMNAQLEAAKAYRRAQVEELNAAALGRLEGPLETIVSAAAVKEDEISKKLGLGRTYGAPRQTAQTKINSLTVQLISAKDRCVGLLRYLEVMSRSSSDRLKRDLDTKTPGSCLGHPLCQNEQRSLLHESVSACNIVVRAMLSVCANMQMLKVDAKSKSGNPYDAASIQLTPAVHTDKAACPVILKDGLNDVLGPVSATDKADTSFNAVFSEYGKKGSPDFMIEYIDKAKANFSALKKTLTDDLFSACTEFRTKIFPLVGKAVFNDIVNRFTAKIVEFNSKATAEFIVWLKHMKAERAANERQLSPLMAYSSNKGALAQLNEAEAKRKERNLQKTAEFKKKIDGMFSVVETDFVADASTAFADLLYLVDKVPPPTEFVESSGALTDGPLIAFKYQGLKKSFQSDETVLTAEVASFDTPSHRIVEQARDSSFASFAQTWRSASAEAYRLVTKSETFEGDASKVWKTMNDDLVGNTK